MEERPEQYEPPKEIVRKQPKNLSQKKTFFTQETHSYLKSYAKENLNKVDFEQKL